MRQIHDPCYQFHRQLLFMQFKHAIQTCWINFQFGFIKSKCLIWNSYFNQLPNYKETLTPCQSCTMKEISKFCRNDRNNFSRKYLKTGSQVLNSPYFSGKNFNRSSYSWVRHLLIGNRSKIWRHYHRLTCNYQNLQLKYQDLWMIFFHAVKNIRLDIFFRMPVNNQGA